MKKLLLVLGCSLIGSTYATTESAPAKTKSSVLVKAKDCNMSSPCEVIKTSAQILSQAVNQNISDEKSFTMIQNSIVPQINFDLMTRLALGSNWSLATKAQQDQLIELFKQQLIYSYTSALSRLKGAQVTITDSNIIGDKQNKAIVNSTLAMPSNGNSKNQPINIEYDLAKINNAWKIYDVKLEKVSIVTTYRSQFNDIVQNNGGVAELIKQLHAKVDNLKNDK